MLYTIYYHTIPYLCKKIPMEYPKCTICGSADATQKNSHLIPSFMVSKVCSYDGSGKRDKEVMITMSSYQDKVYLGAVPDTKVEELFDKEKLTDERINKELKDNTATKDYIFCPKCEAKLSRYLESPYAEAINKGKDADNFVAYFFWVSIVWRMSISKQFQFSIPSEVEEKLGRCLQEYFIAIENGNDISPIVEQCPFNYKILHSPSYLPNKLAYLGGRYWETDNLLALTLGDTILCVKFDEGEIPEDFTYLGIEKHLLAAPFNNGMDTEQKIEIETDVFEQAMLQMVKETAMKRLCNEKELADAIWNKVGLEGTMPDEIFKVFMEKLYSENVKQGDRKTDERYVELFNKTLEEFGYIGK